MENTIIVFSSDHGLGVGSHGLRGKQSMYEHTINVPLIFRGPKIPRNRRTSAQVYLREIYPTVCDLCSIPIPMSVEGRSFASVVRGNTQAHHQEIFGYFRDKQRMIRGDRFKLIDYPEADRQQLFDLKKDPMEMQDLIKDPRHNDMKLRLDRRLRAWRQKAASSYGNSPPKVISMERRRCAKACHEENNHDRPSNNSYIRVLEMAKGSIDLEKLHQLKKLGVPDISIATLAVSI